MSALTVPLPDSIPDTFLAYVAGFFDGEGTIAACIKFRVNRNSYGCVVQVAIGNTNKTVLEYIQGLTGLGNIREVQVKYPNAKIIYHWALTNQTDKLKFLKLILPFLKVKRLNAELAIKYFESRIATGHLPSAHNPLTKGELELIKRMRSINGRRRKNSYENLC